MEDRRQHREEEERDRGGRPPRTARRAEGANAHGEHAHDPTTGPSTGNRDERPERGQTRQRRAQPPPPDRRVKSRPPDASRRRRARSNRARDEPGPDASGQIQGRESPDASRQPEGGHTAGHARKTDGRDEFEPEPSEGQNRIQKARTEPQRPQNRPTGKHRGQEPPKLNLRIIPDGAPPAATPCREPRVSRRCVMHPAVLQGGLAVGASGIARRVVTVPSASQLPTR